MNSVIECARCGFANWPGETVCGRCASPLSFIEEVPSGGAAGWPARPAHESNRCSFCGTEFEGFYCTLCRKPVRAFVRAPEPEAESAAFATLLAPTKTKLVVAALVVALAAAALVARSYGVGESWESHGAAIRNSFDFQTPVSVSFAERAEEVAPGVEVLRELGLVDYRLGTLTLRRVRTDLALWTEDYTPGEGGEIVPGAKSVRLAAVTLTEAGQRGSAAWGTYKPPAGPQSPWGEPQGWRVPLGAREFAGVRSVRPASGESRDLFEVVFAWRWRPNELGRHFDVSGEEFKRLSPAAQLSAASRDFNDSTRTYLGQALLRYEHGAWAIQNLTFGEGAKK